MKTLHRLLTGMLALAVMLSLFCFSFSASAATLPKSNLWSESSWVNTFPGTTARVASSKSVDLYMAKNEYESAQILWRNAKAATISKVAFTNLKSAAGDRIPYTDISWNFVEYMQLPFNSRYDTITGYYDETPFPEKLSHKKTCAVEANTTQAIWVTVRTGKDTPAGNYAGVVTLTTSLGTYEMPVNVTVYDVLVPDADQSEYLNIGWMHATESIPYVWDVEPYSDEFWKILEQWAAAMDQDRITSIKVPTLELLADGGTKMTKDGAITFNWSLVDKYVQFFLDRCHINLIEGLGALISGTFGGGEGAAYILSRYGKDNTESVAVDPHSAEAESFMKQYLPALEAHLKEKGWHDMWYQYVGDEPTATSVELWKYAYDNWLAKYTTLKCHCAFGANDTVLAALTDRVDLWVPLITSYDGNLSFFAERTKKGEKVINYTCTVPQGKAINRFIDGTFVRTRILHWYNYLKDCPGTLHWAYDYWMWAQDLANSPGDMCIVYPDSDGSTTLVQSIRGALLRDGIEEYEIFRMLGAIDEKTADGLVAQVVTSATEFKEDDPALMQELRIKALKALDGKNFSVGIERYGAGTVTADKERVAKNGSVTFTVSGSPKNVTATVGGKEVKPAAKGNTYTVSGVTGPVVLYVTYTSAPAKKDVSSHDPAAQAPTTVPTKEGDSDASKATDNGMDGYLLTDKATGVRVLGNLGEDNTLIVSATDGGYSVELAHPVYAQVQLPLPAGMNADKACVLLGNKDMRAVVCDGVLAFETEEYGNFTVTEKSETPGTDGKTDNPTDDPSTEPETDQPTTGEIGKKPFPWLWVAIGGGALLIIAAVIVLLVLKSKKGGAHNA